MQLKEENKVLLKNHKPFHLLSVTDSRIHKINEKQIKQIKRYKLCS